MPDNRLPTNQSLIDLKDSIDLLTANINRTASNIAYDNNLTIKGKIDEVEDEIYDVETISFTSSVFADNSKIKVRRNGKIIKISFSGAQLNTNVSKYGSILSSLPWNSYGYSTGLIFAVNGNTTTQTSVYINDSNNNLQINDAITSGTELYGSLIYIS